MREYQHTPGPHTPNPGPTPTHQAAAPSGVAAPSQRYWLTMRSEGGSVVDIRPCMVGPAVRAAMLLRFAEYYLLNTYAARYVEVTPELGLGEGRAILAIAWIPAGPHGAEEAGVEKHITWEGLGML